MEAAAGGAPAFIVPLARLFIFQLQQERKEQQAQPTVGRQRSCLGCCTAALPSSLHPFKLLKIANKINEELQSHELPALPVQNVAFDLRLQLLEAVK